MRRKRPLLTTKMKTKKTILREMRIWKLMLLMKSRAARLFR